MNQEDVKAGEVCASIQPATRGLLLVFLADGGGDLWEQVNEFWFRPAPDAAGPRANGSAGNRIGYPVITVQGGLSKAKHREAVRHMQNGIDIDRETANLTAGLKPTRAGLKFSLVTGFDALVPADDAARHWTREANATRARQDAVLDRLRAQGITGFRTARGGEGGIFLSLPSAEKLLTALDEPATRGGS